MLVTIGMLLPSTFSNTTTGLLPALIELEHQRGDVEAQVDRLTRCAATRPDIRVSTMPQEAAQALTVAVDVSLHDFLIAPAFF